MKSTLHWPKHPSKLKHHILGRRLRWTDRSKRYRIERFPDDGNPNFIVLVFADDWRVVSHHRELRPAKLFCHKHDRQIERNNHVPRRRSVPRR